MNSMYKILFLLISFNLNSMSFFNNPGKQLIKAVNKGKKEEAEILLKKKDVHDEYKNKALWAAIFKNNRELVDILIDNGANLSRLNGLTGIFKFYRNIGHDSQKIELLLYVTGFLSVINRRPLSPVENYNGMMKNIVTKTYLQYVFQGNEDYQIVCFITGINRDCSKLIIEYTGKFDNLVTNQDIVKLRYDDNWLKVIISTIMNFWADLICTDCSTVPYNINRVDLYFASILLQYISPRCKKSLLEFAKARKNKKLIVLIQKSITEDESEDEREYLV